MKRILAICVLALLPVAAAPALEEGRDYIALPTPQPVETGDKIEVREFFWYGCPHCYSLEPVIDRWLQRKPANVSFVRTHATYPSWMTHARAFYTFAALGATAQTHSALFRALHQQRRPLNTEQDLAAFAQEQGIDAAKFRQAFNSFGVRTELERAKQLVAAYQVTSVPMFAIDGKYITSPAMAGSETAFIAVLDQLVERAARERAGAAKGRGR